MVMHREFVAEIAYEDIELGETASITKMISEADVVNFAGIIGDFNPLHVNPVYAKDSMFGERICHGMLTASFISTLVGCGIPGRNGLYLSQEVKFVKPVKIGDTITATAEVIEKIDAKRRIVMHTVIKNQRDEVVVDGKAVVMVMKKKQ